MGELTAETLTVMRCDFMVQVEWDTDPGRQEVQAITTSTYIGANEIQTVTTSATRVDAVQYITTSATQVLEVQVSTLLPMAGWSGG